ncbi:hypothetical protein RchiOBHm_Chr2g0117281 [Rosa chinensis]|uniref:Uncharacterized protein n=1 Tax=Rosa chinensis TaxID=74649 RepID=A0A2P6RRG6_ROSCH|nr:hypothetical protein RchiOBHm_Chr2g0117281 [Rosa chinensis]
MNLWSPQVITNQGYWTKSAVDRDWRFNFFGVFERTKRLFAQGRPTVGEDTKAPFGIASHLKKLNFCSKF